MIKTKFPILSAVLQRDGLKVSGKMLAVLGCITGIKVTEPAITELCITSDGFLLAGVEGDIGLNEMLGTASDLNRNLKGICDVLEIKGKERENILTAVSQF